MGSISPSEVTLPSNKTTCESLLVFWQEQDHVCAGESQVPPLGQGATLFPHSTPSPPCPTLTFSFCPWLFPGLAQGSVSRGGEQDTCWSGPQTEDRLAFIICIDF